MMLRNAGWPLKTSIEVERTCCGYHIAEYKDNTLEKLLFHRSDILLSEPRTANPAGAVPSID